MKIKFSSIIFCFAILVSLQNLHGQILTDNKPVNFYYSKVDIVHLDEFANKRSGIAFFYVKNDYLNHNVKNYVDLMFNNTSSDYGFYKLYRNRYRFTNYSIKVVDQQNTLSPDCKYLIDSIRIEIWAKKNIKKFNFRKLRGVINFLSDEKIYSGYVVLIRTFTPSEFPSVKMMKLIKSKIILEKGNFNYRKELSDNIISYWPATFFSFDESILRKNKLSVMNHLNEYFLGTDNNSFLIRFPLDYNIK